VISLFTAVLFAAINNNSSSGTNNNRPGVTSEKNSPENIITNDNLYDAGNSDINGNLNFTSNSYIPVNSYTSEDMNLINASI